MTMRPPDYFIEVQQQAARRWDQLDADPVLAGPWRQLFRQVKSPRHVLSELLQNADDVNATLVKATIRDNVFEFLHDGEDFDYETLQSICQFGLSNKRHLHTIGFRGIGFKSVFSLGDRVEIRTPTVSFAFTNKRFTEPIWVPKEPTKSETIITVEIDNEFKVNALLGEFKHWIKSPLPLLFFNHIEQLQIQEQLIQKDILSKGPVANSRYVKLTNEKEVEVLIIHSEPEEFPVDALEEIRDERGSLDIELPPCTVSIVYRKDGQKRHLYTVLPTDIELTVPFSCNAPFVQDPARKEIKHPANSCTNRWLLTRIGKLACNAMREWLQNTELELDDRAQAYRFLPRSPTIESDDEPCSRIILEAFKYCLALDEKIVLSHEGKLFQKNGAAVLPDVAIQTWGREKALKTFAPHKDALVALQVSDRYVQRLKAWSFIYEMNTNDFLGTLSSYRIPIPDDLENLIYLWDEILQVSQKDHAFIVDKEKVRQLAIVPVEGKDTLYQAKEVTVLGDKDTNLSDDDWASLVEYLNIVSTGWVKLATAPREPVLDEKRDGKLSIQKERVFELFGKLGFINRVNTDQVIHTAAKMIFGKPDIANAGIWIAHVAAKANISVGNDFKYLCADGVWRDTSYELLAAGTDTIDLFLSKELVGNSLIASDIYQKDLTANELTDWLSWISNGSKSKLLLFPKPKLVRNYMWQRSTVESFCKERGGHVPRDYYYKNPNFYAYDYDWDKTFWDYWDNEGKEHTRLWQSLIKAIIKAWDDSWESTAEAKIVETWGKHKSFLDHGELRSQWLQRLRNLPCIPDTFDNLYILPTQLCRLTHETQALQNIEKFVHEDFDKPEYAKILDLLGVRSRDVDQKLVVDRLRALAQTNSPPISALVDLYRVVDNLILGKDRDNHVQFFASALKMEALIFSESGDWAKLGNDVFQENPDGIPGVMVIHPEAAKLSMWNQLGVTKQPTLQMAILWLRNQPRDNPLSKSDRERAIQILRRATEEVWNNAQGWLNTLGYWTESSKFFYGTKNQHLLSKLFANIKMQTADFSMLEDTIQDICDKFRIYNLESVITHRFKEVTPGGEPFKPSWLGALGDVLAHLRQTEGDGKTNDFRGDLSSAERLKKSNWQEASSISVAPYIAGGVVGEEMPCKVYWHNATIYAVNKESKLLRELIDELLRNFRTPLMRKIITDCVARDPNFIKDYADEYLDLEEDNKIETELVEKDETEAEEDFKDTVIVKTSDGMFESKAELEEDTQAKSSKKELEIKQHRSALVSPTEIFKKFMEKSDFEWSENTNALINNQEDKIIKGKGIFPWVQYDLSGRVISQFWIGQGSTEEGFELPAEVWNFPSNNDGEIFVVLIDEDAKTIKQYPLLRLKSMAEDGKIGVYPTKFVIRTIEY